MPILIDLSGLVFGRLTASARDPTNPANWLCRCLCGAEKSVAGQSLRAGTSRSCGCLRKEVASIRHGTHRMTKTATHRSWAAMKNRCHNRLSDDYAAYGGRGIKVCARWSRFEAFLVDMGERPKGMTIDRIDNDGAYKPSNCRWASATIQANNSRWNHRVTIDGVLVSFSDACRIKNVVKGTAKARMRAGWPESHWFIQARRPFFGNQYRNAQAES
jgi:hypothetical protein